MKRAGRLFALPLVLLALALQFGAAVAATRAQAEAAGDPFAAAPICSPGDPQSGADGKAPAGQHGDHHCPLCLVSAVAQAPPLLAVADIVFPEGPKTVAVPALARYAQARGPPLYAPHARGPPTHA